MLALILGREREKKKRFFSNNRHILTIMSLQNVSISEDMLDDKLNANSLHADIMDGKIVAERDVIDNKDANRMENSDYMNVDSDDDGNVNIHCVANGLQVNFV